jgi:hypothetical protein
MSTGGPISWYTQDGIIWNGMQGIVNMLITPTSTGNESLYYYNSGFNLYPDPNRQENPYGYGSSVGYPGYLCLGFPRTPSGKSPLDTLLDDITNSATRNFFCFSHNTAIHDPNNPDLENHNGSVKLWSGAIANLLGNGPFYYPSSGVVENNPYRFVFLYACRSAETRKWYQAWGIVPASAEEAAARSNIGPQAFVGWADDVDDPFDYNEDIATAFTETLQGFYALWMSGHPLAQCIQWASTPQNGKVAFPIKKYTVTMNGVTYTSEPSKLVVVGHPGLKVDGLDPSWDVNKDYFRY